MNTVPKFRQILSWLVIKKFYGFTKKTDSSPIDVQHFRGKQYVVHLAILLSLFVTQVPLNTHASTATTEDRSSATPTSWWVYTGETATSITNKYNANGARLTDVEIHSIVSGVPRFTVRMVKNSGDYAVPGWWWYYGLTYAQISPLLTTNNGRLIDIEAYDAGSGNIRYAVIMVSNTGVAQRSWSWLAGVSSSQIATHISTSGHRIIDLDTYFVGTSKYYNAVFVANTGTDAKTWQWWLNLTSTGVSDKLKALGGRLVDIERLPDGKYNVVMVKNSGTDAYAWWWQLGFTSITNLLNYANQLAARPVDIETYLVSGQRRYSAIFIDNANAATQRIRGVFATSFLDANGNPTKGVFEAYLKQAGLSVLVDLNSRRPTEVASSLKSLHLLHAMRSVQNGESLASSFVYYNYPSSTQPLPKDACPNPTEEILANQKTDYNLGKGLSEMMSISDNRTTRGMVLRYGFPAINQTATMAGMTGTTLRSNIGCAYYDPLTGLFNDPGNDTTAADLSRLYELVWTSNMLTGTPRDEFLQFANPGSGVGADLQAIINQEATAQNKSGIAAQFGALVRTWGKGGSYGACLGPSTSCGQKVTIRSGTGIIRFPVKTTRGQLYRTYVYARLISDVPVSCWNCAEETAYINTYSKASNELFREVIRSALLTW